MALPISSPPERRKGFTPLPNECLWDWSRLVSGDAQVLSVLFLNSELHPVRERGAAPLKWTRSVSNEELASFVRCTVRAIQIATDDMVARKVVLRKKASGGYSYSIPFETWAELPDRPAKVVVLAEAEAAQEETEEEAAEAANKPGKEVVLAERLTIRAGKRTKPLKFNTGPEFIQVDSNVDAEINAVEKSGVVRVTVTARFQETKGEVKRNTFRENNAQPTENTQNRKLQALHTLLDDYCRRHHGTIPNDKLLTKVCQAMGKATITQFQAVFTAKVRAGKAVPMGLFINLADDARLGAESPSPKPAASKVQPADEILTDDLIIQALKDLAHDPADKISRAVIEGVPPARVDRIKAQLRGKR